jgi:ribonuclease-3
MSSHELTSRRLAALENRLGHAFEKRELLVTALTHSSWANEQKPASPDHYERLEFLGDAVLGLVISDLLYRRGEDEEGILTLEKNTLVSAPTLADHARALGLGDYLRLGAGEEQSGGRDKPSLLANVMEAVIGAIYIDGGFAAAKRFVKRLFAESMQQIAGGTRRILDFKSALQERLQASRLPTPDYRVIEETGPAHQRTFTVALLLFDRQRAVGTGSTKKAAEQEAAREFLNAIESGVIDLTLFPPEI